LQSSRGAAIFLAMTTDEMKTRTKALALRVMKMTDHLPGGRKAQVLSDQILRSAMSVAANYRAACRGRSAAEFTAKLGIAVEEADETCLWLELITEGGLLPENKLKSLRSEADEVTAMLFSAARTMKQRVKN
jgi:four helix bundle protein